MKTKWKVIAAAGVIALSSGIAFAGMENMQEQMMQRHMAQGGMMHDQGKQGSGMGPGMMHGGMHGGSQGTSKGDQSPASLAFQGVNAKMHAAMDITYTGNADADFVKGMIPHHEGAVDMAKIVLAFGKDAEVRKLAEGVIKAQEEEIAWMKSWLQKNGK